MFAHQLFIAFGCLLLTILALASGATLATPRIGVAVADPASDRYLDDLSDVERSAAGAFRWTGRDAAIDLGGMQRVPTLLTLRMAAPRPPEAPPADASLRVGAWRSQTFRIAQDVRRYRLLLPGSAGRIQLVVVPFQPGGRDGRSLGVAIVGLAAAPAALTPAWLVAPTIVGGARLLTLLLAPLVVLLALHHTFGARWLLLGAALAAVAALAGGVALSRPLGTARWLSDGWPLPVALLLVLGITLIGRRWEGLGSGAVLRPSAIWLPAVLLQGALLLLLVPPWQHYDEPAHFEYARLIADTGQRPAYGERSIPLEREIIGSMWASGFFARGVPPPALLSDGQALAISGGGTATGHPPPYYMLASLPLRLMRWLDIGGQLLVARSVSLVCLALTALAAAAVAADLTRPGHPLRWLAPLLIGWYTSFTDLMTAFNNDTAAIACTSLFFWAATRTIVAGPSPRRVVALCLTAVAAAAVKNTGAVALLFAPPALLVALAVARGWRWLLPVGAVALLALLPAVLAWDDADAWYRWAWPAQAAPTRVIDAAAPLGSAALRLDITPGAAQQQLSNPLLRARLDVARGRTVTVGAYLWASRPVRARIGVLLNTDRYDTPQTETVLLGTSPTFYAMRLKVPREASRMQQLIGADDATLDAPATIFADGAVVAVGAFDTAQTPQFADSSGLSGAWGGRPFANLLRNPSAEAAGLHFRSWVEVPLGRYARRSPSATLRSIVDVARTGQLTFVNIPLDMVDSLFSQFGWGGSMLAGDGWRWVARATVLLSLLGALWWWARHWRSIEPRRRAALLFLGAAGAAIWANAILRVHPIIDTSLVYSSTRYAFPAIVPMILVLAGGMLALWPERRRGYGLALLLGGALLLNAVALSHLWQFYAL